MSEAWFVDGLFVDLYDILGVKPDATVTEIEKAHARESRKWHPDANPDAAATGRQQLINIARDTLLSDDRAAFDLEWEIQHGPKLSVAPPAVDFGTVEPGDRRSVRLHVLNLGGPGDQAWYEPEIPPFWYIADEVPVDPLDNEVWRLTLHLDTIGIAPGRVSSELVIGLDHATVDVPVSATVIATSATSGTGGRGPRIPADGPVASGPGDRGTVRARPAGSVGLDDYRNWPLGALLAVLLLAGLLHTVLPRSVTSALVSLSNGIPNPFGHPHEHASAPPAQRGSESSLATPATTTAMPAGTRFVTDFGEANVNDCGTTSIDRGITLDPANGLIYVSDGILGRAYSTSDGSLVWQSALPPNLTDWPSGATSGAVRAFPTTDGGVVAMNASSGQQAWSLPGHGASSDSSSGCSTSSDITLGASGNIILVAGYHDEIQGIDASTGHQIWVRTGHHVASADIRILTVQGDVAVVKAGNQVIGLNAATSNNVWSYNASIDTVYEPNYSILPGGILHVEGAVCSVYGVAGGCQNLVVRISDGQSVPEPTCRSGYAVAGSCYYVNPSSLNEGTDSESAVPVIRTNVYNEDAKALVLQDHYIVAYPSSGPGSVVEFDPTGRRVVWTSPSFDHVSGTAVEGNSLFLLRALDDETVKLAEVDLATGAVRRDVDLSGLAPTHGVSGAGPVLVGATSDAVCVADDYQVACLDR